MVLIYNSKGTITGIKMKNPKKLAPEKIIKAPRSRRPTPSQLEWLKRGLEEPGGKLPLFDRLGQKVSGRTIKSCIDMGWASPWFDNPIKPDWLVCKLTDEGRQLVAK
tara:strand:- start:41 stop:361 length:321 start_codon:yes stop_codon:yes gene_type:complete